MTTPRPNHRLTWRPFAIGGLVLLLLVVVGLVVWGFRDQQPIYGGRPLTQWVAEASSPDPAKRVPAENAIREMGTNALPTLVWCLEVRDSSIDLAVMRAERKLPSPVWRFLCRRTKPYHAALLRDQAARALGLLGEKSASAVPALVTLLDDPVGRVRIAAVRALQEIGPAAVPAMIDALSGSLNRPREAMISALARMGALTNEVATVGVDMLIQTTNRNTASIAIHALGRTGVFAVEPLLRALSSTSIDNRPWVVEAIGTVAVSDFEAFQRFVEASGRGTSEVKTGVLEGLAQPMNVYGVGLAAARALGDDDPKVRDYARQLIRNQESPESLRFWLTKEPEAVRARAMAVFEE